jgi:hypothetical protein
VVHLHLSGELHDVALPVLAWLTPGVTLIGYVTTP